MLRNYLKIAYRNVTRNKGSAFINIISLAVGLAACLLIGGWVRHELSYDDFHEKAERIFRVVIDEFDVSGKNKRATTQAILAPTLDAELPAIEEAVRLKPTSQLFRHKNQQFYEEKAYYADPAVLNVLTFPLLYGNPETALDAPGSIVISRELARKYFDSGNPIGRTITSDKERALTVTGVLKEVPVTSHLQIDALISISTIEEDEGETGIWRNWASFSSYTYVLLREGANQEDAARAMNRLLERYAGEQMERLNLSSTYSLEPLQDVHLRSAYGGPGASGNITNVYVFSLVALFILVLACVNYMNLTTAQSWRRAKEVGVRKTAGAYRGSLALQFLFEAVLLSAAAGLLAALLARLAQPIFEAVTGTPLSIHLGVQAVLVLIGVTLATGLLAGIYPALVLSRYRPAEALKGGSISGPSGALRKGLVVFQFAVAVALIAGTGVVFNQLRYMQQQDLGFETREGGVLMTINFGGDEDVQEHLSTVKRRLKTHPAVTGVTASVYTPGSGTRYGAGGTLERRDGTMKQASVSIYMVDADFIDLYGMEIIAGRAFSEKRAIDSTSAFILNETAVRKHGFHSPEEVIGRAVEFWGQEGRVVGVVQDFHHAGLQEGIPPIAMLVWPSWFETLTLRVQTDDLSQTLSELEALWHDIAPGRPFDYAFVDENFAAQYRAEQRFGRIVSVFAGLAILIACLGLFGLAAHTAQRRTKEIGIRKVLGASVPGIVALLSKDFLKLILVAFGVAAPVAYYAMHQWLQGFAYRIDLGVGVFALAGALAVFIALATVSYQAIRAALADPVNALRSE